MLTDSQLCFVGKTSACTVLHVHIFLLKVNERVAGILKGCVKGRRLLSINRYFDVNLVFIHPLEVISLSNLAIALTILHQIEQ